MSLPEWSRALGRPLFTAKLRHHAEDFQVVEHLGWHMTGDGEHDYLFIEKTGTNTEWLSRQLAHHAQVPVRDVGYAGLKDRHAVTRQWFSVPRWHRPDWQAFHVDGIRVVDIQRHQRKLRRGAHDGNSFRIVLRDPTAYVEAFARERLAAISACGVPNYFGEQRFGRHGGNLQLADSWAGGKRLPRPKRSLAISTIRAFVFNEALSERVEQKNWNRLISGEKANLDGSASVFDIGEVDEELDRRCNEMDVHPSLELVGDGSRSGPAHWRAALAKARVEPGHRSLRLRVRELSSEVTENGVVLSFSLGKGAYATAVLREFCDWS